LCWGLDEAGVDDCGAFHFQFGYAFQVVAVADVFAPLAVIL
jgi:hypothetical protein